MEQWLTHCVLNARMERPVPEPWRHWKTATEDNYSYDACAMYSDYPVSSTTTPKSGMLYVSLCYARRGRRKLSNIRKVLDSRADLIASVSMFKCTESELPLKVASRENDSFK